MSVGSIIFKTYWSTLPELWITVKMALNSGHVVQTENMYLHKWPEKHRFSCKDIPSLAAAFSKGCHFIQLHLYLKSSIREKWPHLSMTLHSINRLQLLWPFFYFDAQNKARSITKWQKTREDGNKQKCNFSIIMLRSLALECLSNVLPYFQTVRLVSTH